MSFDFLLSSLCYPPTRTRNNKNMKTMKDLVLSRTTKGGKKISRNRRKKCVRRGGTAPEYIKLKNSATSDDVVIYKKMDSSLSATTNVPPTSDISMTVVPVNQTMGG